MKSAAAIDLLLALMQNAARISSLITQARLEGREELTPDELQSIILDNDGARALLVDAIARARGDGR